MKKVMAAVFCLALLGCERAATGPEKRESPLVKSAVIDLPDDSLLPNESIRLEPDITFEEEVDTAKVRYSWSITKDGLPVDLEEAVGKTLDWVPAEPGRYWAQLTMEYQDQRIQVLVLVVVLEGKSDSAPLDWFKQGIVGEWKGAVVTPWIAPYGIEMVFRADGNYSSRGLGPISPDSPSLLAEPAPVDTGVPDSTGPATWISPGLYYGSDEDSPLKTYNLDDVDASGNASGEIVVYFAPTTTVDELRHVRLSEDKTRLSFDLWHLGHGPIKVEMVREP